MVKKHTSKILFLTILSLLFLNCSHTNELAKFNLVNKTVLFKYYSNSDLARVNVSIDNEYLYKDNPFTVILTDIGESYAESEIIEKLQRALFPDSISSSISKGIEEGLITYYDMKPVDTISDKPDYIVETRFERFRLSSSRIGVFANIDSRVMIIDRKTAKTVWENSESSHVPIYDVVISYTGSRIVRTTKSIVNAIRLMQMTEEEICRCRKYVCWRSG
ncbi:MAG: hypothetical protein H8D45_03970 [Bacteroidetes bacterium]|nr:hypothetical protein [Bacteroidota bacterium]